MAFISSLSIAIVIAFLLLPANVNLLTSVDPVLWQDSGVPVVTMRALTQFHLKLIARWTRQGVQTIREAQELDHHTKAMNLKYFVPKLTEYCPADSRESRQVMELATLAVGMCGIAVNTYQNYRLQVDLDTLRSEFYHHKSKELNYLHNMTNIQAAELVIIKQQQRQLKTFFTKLAADLKEQKREVSMLVMKNAIEQFYYTNSIPLDKFLHQFKLDGTINLNFEVLFPNLEVCNRTAYCPRNFWKGKACKYNPKTSELVMKIETPIATKAKVLLRSVSFRIAKRIGDKFCFARPEFTRYALLDLRSQGVTEVSFDPMQEKIFQTSDRVIPTNSAPISSIWKFDGCKQAHLVQEEELIAVFETEKFLYIYCNTLTMTINNIPLKCQQMMYKLPSNYSIRIGSANLTTATRLVFSETVLKVPFDVNEVVNADLFNYGNFSLMEKGDKLIEEAEMALREQDAQLNRDEKTVFLNPGHPASWALLICLVLLAIAFGVLLWCKCRKPAANAPEMHPMVNLNITTLTSGDHRTPAEPPGEEPFRLVDSEEEEAELPSFLR